MSDQPVEFTTIGTDDAAEEALLAACLQSLAARKEARAAITELDFHQPARAAIWQAMADLDRDRQPVDPMTVRAAIAKTRGATEVLLRIMAGHVAVPEHAAAYAATVRSWAVRRRIETEAIRTRALAANLDVDAAGLTSTVASRFAAIRDTGSVETAHGVTMADLLAEPDDEPDWVLPGLLERRDRLILTGGEGGGKSHLLRQVGIFAAAGIDPFDLTHIRPCKVLVIDCENSQRQVRRRSRGLVDFAQHHGQADAAQHITVVNCGRIDVLRDRDLAMVHREVDATQPDILVIGPLYAMSPKAVMTDDDAVPLLAILDGLRESGAALLMEAHAGHANGPDGRNFRPRGSSALLGWPEFGYGMKPVAQGYSDLVPWRGDRDARRWPRSLKHDRDGIRWVEHDGRGYETQPDRMAWSARSSA